MREQEERLTGKVKLAVREAVEEMLAGEIQALKAMIEASNPAVNKLSGDIAQQAEVGRRLQGRLDARLANIRVVKHVVGDLQKELLNLGGTDHGGLTSDLSACQGQWRVKMQSNFTR